MEYNKGNAIRVPVFDQYGREVPEYGIQCEFLTPCLSRSQARVRREMEEEREQEQNKVVDLKRKKRQLDREDECLFWEGMGFSVLLIVIILLLMIIG